MKASIGLAIVAFLLMSAALFGNSLAVLNFVTPSRGLNTPHWKLGVVAALAISLSVFFPPVKRYVSSIFRPSVFVAYYLTLSLIFVGIYADFKRREAISAFRADRVLQHSFFQSIREVPKEYQFFLHAAALKNCVPYAWSYSAMDFYELPPDAAVNVIPSDWTMKCHIRPTH